MNQIRVIKKQGMKHKPGVNPYTGKTFSFYNTCTYYTWIRIPAYFARKNAKLDDDLMDIVKMNY